MTKKTSPLRELKAQACRIAQSLKAADRGEPIAYDPGGKIAAARGRESFKFAIAMDDKVISIDMPWATIRTYSEVGLAEYFLKLMRETRNNA